MTTAGASVMMVLALAATLRAASPPEVPITISGDTHIARNEPRSKAAPALPTSYLLGQPASAPPSPKLGWVKVQLTWADRKVEPIPLSSATAAGAEDVADYGSYRIMSVPERTLKAFGAELAGHGIRIREVDNFDRIDTPGASIDVRRGIDPLMSPAQLIHAYPPKTNGLYLVQFVGPAKAEWYKALLDIGWSIARYLPANAYVVAGPPELAARTIQLPFVQFFDFYHPFEKAAVRFRDGASHDVLLEVQSIEGKKEAIDAIGLLAAAGSLRVDSHENDTYVHARIKDSDATAILAYPLVIGIGAEPVMGLSDERRSLSLTSNVTAAGSQPVNPATYSSWLAARCSLCTATNMPYSTWRVGIADTGLDGGLLGGHHPDLDGREYWAGVFASPTDNCPGGDCDDYTHGTMVASIVAGSAALGMKDSLNYYYGMGIAPMAGVLSTKIFSRVGAPVGDIFAWAQDAASQSPPVTVQNHSYNDYGGATDPSGLYTTSSRQYDLATRDADNDTSNGLVPILFTVSSGNTGQGPYANSPSTLPPATAKNVISMGRVENYRPDQDALACRGSKADDFRNILFEGRHGTLIPGYIKPDLVAPASMIVSARSRWNPMTPRGYCQENVDGNYMYEMDSGTSFAAPAAAGAAILVKRYLGSLPADVSPAGVKAVLIAGAHSVRGGTDRSTTPNIPVGPVPNSQQGFGRLSLDDVLTGATPPVLVDQTSLRHFTSSGQTRTTRLTVRDTLKPVVVALVWTDAPGTANSDPIHPVNPLVNDLDLTVYPLGTTQCRYMQGNYINQTVNPSRGEESISAPCTQAATPDSVNNVEYARFFADDFTQFDVRVTGSMIQAPGDPAYPLYTNQDFALVVLNADLVNGGVAIPPQLTTTRDTVTPTTIHLNWTEALNMIVDHYEIKRGSTASNLGTVYSNEHGTTKDDVGRPSGVNTWVYQVTAVGTISSGSNISIATTIKFDDDPLMPFVTPVRARHVEQLRQAIDAIRSAAQLGATVWADGTSLLGVVVKANHVTQMRSALDQALAQLNQPSSAYTPLSAYIKAQDISEVRAHVK